MMDLTVKVLFVVFVLSCALFRSFGVVRNSGSQVNQVRTNIRFLQILSWILLILFVILSFSARGGQKENWFFLLLFMGIMGGQLSQIVQSLDNRLAVLENAHRNEIK